MKISLTRPGLGLILLILLPQVLLAIPAPQRDDESSTASSAKPAKTTTEDIEYVDADVKKSDKKKKPVKDSSGEDEDDFDVGDAIGDILEGAFGIFRGTVKTVAEVVHNMSLPEKVGDAVKVGLNVTQKLVEMGGDAIENPEKIIKEKQVFVKGLGKTIEETGHLVKAGVDELGHHAKLGSSFIKAYSESMMGQLEGFLKIFDDRLRCNTQCKRKKDAEEKQICEEKYCKEIEKEDDDDKDSVVSTKGKKKGNLTKNKDDEKEIEREEDSEEEYEEKKESKKNKENSVDE